MVVANGVVQEFLHRKGDRADAQVESARLHLFQCAVIGLTIDGFKLDDVPGTEQAHEVLEVWQALRRVENRRRSDSEHLVAAGTAHGVNAPEAATVTDGKFGRVGARTQVFGHFDLPCPLDQLEQERQARHETHHRDEPWRTAVRRDKLVHRLVTVYVRGVLDIGGSRLLMTLTEAYEYLVRPRVVVEHRNLDDTRIEFQLDAAHVTLEVLQQLHHVSWVYHVGVELYLVGRVCGADLRDARHFLLGERCGNRHALEEGLKRHLLRELDENVLVGSEAVAGGSYGHVCSSGSALTFRMGGRQATLPGNWCRTALR